MKLLIVGLLLGQMTITSYRSVHKQTDDSPHFTSIGEHVHPHGCAVSQDLLKKNGGPINYGDFIYIEGYGIKVVNDTMHKRIKKSVDIWVATYQQEKRIGVKRKNVWIIRTKEDK
jgi:3D (Asp-Asp-Asp) domain-containing protein